LTPRRGKFGRRDRAPAAQQKRSPGHTQKSSADRPAKRGKNPLDGQIVEGTVTANRGGFGFLRVPGQSEDVFLPPS
jgi:hypothetical protein